MNQAANIEPVRRGRPRSQVARQAILEVAYEMLTTQGPGRLTVEAVAAKAGVGKPTIYRYWSNARALEMAALLEQPVPDTNVRVGQSAVADLQAQLEKVVAIFVEKRGRQMTQMIAASESDSELSKQFRNTVILQCREEGRAILQRAVAEQHVRASINIEVALDMIYGPLFYRLLVGHAPLSAAFAKDLVDSALAGLAMKTNC
jgi:AcrR family transcriptional regulator